MNITAKKVCFWCFLILATAIVYKPALNNGFIGDDMYVIVNNDFVKSWANLPRFFDQSYLSTLPRLEMVGQADIGSGELSYRPVRQLSFFIDYAIWKLNPWGFHLTNLILHIINTFLVYVLARRLDLKSMAAGFSALVFLFHPLNNEVIAVIYARSDSLAFLFFALALIFYQNFRNSGYRRFLIYALSVGMYFIALFSKEIAITLPFVIILYDFCFPAKQTFRKRWMFYLGYVGVAIFYLWIWFFVMRPSSEGMMDYFYGDWISVIATMMRIGALYISWLIFPWDIPAALSDESIVVRDFINPMFVFSAIIISLLFLLIANAMKSKSHQLKFALLWAVITILPVLALPWMFNMLYAARFIYIPAIGFCFILGLMWDQAERHFDRRVILFNLGFGLLVFYAFVDMRHLPMWKDNLSISVERLRYYPQSALALTSAASAFEKQGMLNEAEMLYEQSVVTNPFCSDCFNWQGMMYVRMGAYDKAEKCFRQAVNVDPDFDSAYSNLCNTLGQQDRLDASEKCFKEMILKYPKSMQAYFNLGITYVRANRKADAQAVWESGLKIDPNNMKLREALEGLRR